MAAADVDSFQCGYCLGMGGDLVNPKVLPCSHIFCAECLTSAIAEAGILQCGLCREVYNIEVKDLPSASDAGANIHLCGPCARKGHSNEAEVYCTECVTRFCSKHRTHHEECFDHQIVGIDSYSKQTAKLQPRFCTNHPNRELSLGCRSCKDVFCVDCVDSLGNCHTGHTHQIVSLKIITKEMRAEFEGLIKDAYDKEGQLSLLYKQSTQKIAELDTETDALVKTIQAARELRIKTIDEKYRSVEADFKGLREGTKDEISEYQKSVGVKQQVVSSTILKVQADLRDGHEVDLLAGFDDTKQLICKITEEQLPKLSIAVAGVQQFRGKKSVIDVGITSRCTTLSIGLDDAVVSTQEPNNQPERQNPAFIDQGGGFGRPTEPSEDGLPVDFLAGFDDTKQLIRKITEEQLPKLSIAVAGVQQFCENKSAIDVGITSRSTTLSIGLDDAVVRKQEPNHQPERHNPVFNFQRGGYRRGTNPCPPMMGGWTTIPPPQPRPVCQNSGRGRGRGRGRGGGSAKFQTSDEGLLGLFGNHQEHSTNPRNASRSRGNQKQKGKPTGGRERDRTETETGFAGTPTGQKHQAKKSRGAKNKS